MKIKHWISLLTVLLLAWGILTRQERGSPADPGESSGPSMASRSDDRAERSRPPSSSRDGERAGLPPRSRDQLLERAQLRRQTYLTAASVLVGRAIDPEGSGVSGVALELSGESSREPGATGFQGSTISGADGQFRLDLADGFGGWIQGGVDGYAPIRQRVWLAGPGELRLVLVLTPLAGTLNASVSEVFSRRMVPGARVEARLTSPRPSDESTLFECLTGESGECQIQNLPAQRRLRVMASVRGHFEDAKDLQLSPGSPYELALRVIEGPALVLQVRSANDDPIAAARVSRPDGLFGTTDERGEIWMPVIDELVAVPVSVSASGYRSSQATLANDGTLQRIELEPAPVLSGQVRDPAGAPISGVHLVARKPGPDFQEESLTDSSGYFEIPVPDPSSLQLVANRQGFIGWEDEFNMEKPLPSEIEIILRPYSSVVMGQLLDPAGVPLVEARVSFSHLDDSDARPRWAAQAGSGSYLIGDLEPGRYRVRASGSRLDGTTRMLYESGQYSVEVLDGTRIQLDLQMQRKQVVPVRLPPKTRVP